MSQSVGVLDYTWVAEEDLTGSQYCAVTLGTAAGSVKKCTTSDVPIGVLQNAPALGAAAAVRLLGTSKVKADGPFSKNDQLAVADANGELDTVGAAPVNIVGIALEAASKAGVICEMYINRAFVAESIAPAAMTAAATYIVSLQDLTRGEFTAAPATIDLGFARGVGKVVKAGFSLQECGADADDDLTLAMNVLNAAQTIFSTPPALTKAAADGADTFGAAAGVTPGVIDAAHDDVADGDQLSIAWTLTRTTPQTEMADICAYVEIAYKVGV